MWFLWDAAYGSYSERLEREYDLDLIITAPSVAYHVYLTTGKMEEVDNPSALPILLKERKSKSLT